jgi:hypothetical protein
MILGYHAVGDVNVNGSIYFTFQSVDVSCDGILALHTNFVEEEDIERSF